MITLASILLLGFFLGMRHATDADHVIAVTTIVSRQRTISSAAFTGIFWGIGHSLTLCLVGGAIVLFGLVVPERLGLSLEFSVPLMLMALGILNLLPLFRRLRDSDAPAHEHPHAHGDYVHSHAHSHTGHTADHLHWLTPPGWLDMHFGKAKFYQAIRPVIIGIVHGLAGSAAVALLVLPIIRDPIWAMGYLLVFGFRTIIGMMLITAAIALPFLCAGARSHLVHRSMGFATGALSIAFGGFLVYQIGFAQGLFRH